MAPIARIRTTARPLKRLTKSSQTKERASPLPTSSSSSSAFPTSKKDKRQIKHSNLLSRVHKSSLSSEAQRNKRRRQKKQLVVNLESLADALPEDGDDAAGQQGGGKLSKGTALREQANVNIIQRKSMKSRPGALKRREKVDKGERERFAKNLAELSGKKPEHVGERDANVGNGQQAHDRWAALRSFIAQTLEQKPEMKEVKS